MHQVTIKQHYRHNICVAALVFVAETMLAQHSDRLIAKKTRRVCNAADGIFNSFSDTAVV